MLNWKIPNDGATGRLYGDTADGATAPLWEGTLLLFNPWTGSLLV